MTEFTVEQRVKLLPSWNGATRGRKARDAVVTKVGRKYAYVEPDNASPYEAETYAKIGFSLEDGRENTDYPGSAESIMTPEDYDLQRRAADAVEELRRRGISLSHSDPKWTDYDKIDLAQRAAGLPRQEG